MKKINKYVQSYLNTALWSSNDESDDQGGEPLDKNYSISDISNESLKQAQKDLDLFFEKCGSLLDNYDLERVAHDFWLTRNRHGAGFWDGDYKLKDGDGDKLTEIAQSFKEVDCVISDGKIYIE